MKIVFDKFAQLELDDASEYYELEVPGLGARFREEVKRAIRRICAYPDAWAKEKDDVIRYLLHKFPYKILYSIEEDYIYILLRFHIVIGAQITGSAVSWINPNIRFNTYSKRIASFHAG